MRLIFSIAWFFLLVGSSFAGGWELDISNALKAGSVQSRIRPLDSISPLSRASEPNEPNLPFEPPQAVPIDAFPWVVALIAKQDAPGDSYYCTGTFVSANWVLTAGACADTRVRHSNEQFASVGTSNLSRPSRIVAVVKVIVHPDFDPILRKSDMALLKVNAERTPLSLEGPPAFAQIGGIGRVVGWGSTNLLIPKPDFLQQIPAQILDPAVCRGPANYSDQLISSSFCAKSLLKNFEACNGFAGAPLILNDNTGRPYLAGMVSWGDGCPPKSAKPTVYTDVQANKDWIIRTINEN
jgi:hypothetical protein